MLRNDSKIERINISLFPHARKIKCNFLAADDLASSQLPISRPFDKIRGRYFHDSMLLSLRFPRVWRLECRTLLSRNSFASVKSCQPTLGGSSYHRSVSPPLCKVVVYVQEIRSSFLDPIKGLFRYETTKAGEIARHQSGLKSWLESKSRG